MRTTHLLSKNDYERAIQKHLNARSAHGLKYVAAKARDKAAQADFIGWPALAESWMRDAERIDGLILECK